MPVIPVAVVGTDVVAPPGQTFGKFTRPIVRFGKPLDFSRYEGMENDRYILRSITDEIMYEIMRLSGQEYVDMYATRAKEESKKAADADSAGRGRTSRRRRRSGRRVPAPIRRAATWWFGPAGTVEDRLFSLVGGPAAGAAAPRGGAQRLPPRQLRAPGRGPGLPGRDGGVDRRRHLGLRRPPPAGPAPAGRRPRRRRRRRPALAGAEGRRPLGHRAGVLGDGCADGVGDPLALGRRPGRRGRDHGR